MKYMFAFLAAVGLLAQSSPSASGQSNTDMLGEAQAADVLSDLLTYTVDRADARVDAMQQFIREIGKDSAYQQHKGSAQHATPLFFTQVFKGALEFVQSGGAKYADPALKNLNESQLNDHFNTLQAYNMQQFLHLTQQRHASNSMAAFLHSIGEFEHYLKWARGKFPGADAMTPEPAPTTPEQVADRMKQMIQTARAIMWDKAQAMGMSQADFEQRWQQYVEQYRESVAQKVDGIKATASWLTKSELAQAPASADPPAQAPVLWHAGPPVHQMQPTLPAPVQSQYTSAYYTGVNDELWNNWGDPYGDVTYVYSGGGGHHR